MKELTKMRIESYSHDGRGISKHQGKTTFVVNALLDEEVGVQYIKRHRQFDEAIATMIYTANPLRQTPRCEVFGTCGGCQLQHMPHTLQHTIKQNALKELLAHHAYITYPNLTSPLTAEPWHYRRRGRLGVKYVKKTNEVVIGFREFYSRFITRMQQCPVVHQLVDKLIQPLREIVAQLSVKDQIPQIEFCVADNALALIVRHLKPLTEQDKQLLTQFALTHQIQLYCQPKGLNSIYCLAPEIPNDLYYELSNLKLFFQPQQFIQVNKNINEQMVATALQWLAPHNDDVVLDLFCGIGNFSLPLAQHVKKLVGVEGDASAINMAKHNANHNHLNNTEFYCADLSMELSQHDWAKLPYTKLILDPPRSGAELICRQFNYATIQQIVYISCQPATFARDCHLLSAHSFKLTEIKMVDQFPHTGHMEVMALFTRDKS